MLRFGLERIDTQGGAGAAVWFASGQVCSEPVLVPDPFGNAERGSVLTLVFDSGRQTSFVAVLEAQTLAVQAKVQLAQPIPITFHGCWCPANGG